MDGVQHYFLVFALIHKLAHTLPQSFFRHLCLAVLDSGILVCADSCQLLEEPQALVNIAQRRFYQLIIRYLTLIVVFLDYLDAIFQMYFVEVVSRLQAAWIFQDELLHLAQSLVIFA